jgi:type I restriction enzyme S subunit
VRGQVLFGKRRAYQRKAAVAEFDGICSGDILVFEPASDDLLPELLPFIVQSDGFYERALGTSAGSLSPRTNWKSLAAYEFPLPPRAEQQRIAELLWAADAERQALINSLDALKAVVSSVSGQTFGSDSIQRTPLKVLIADNSIDLLTGPFGTVLKASSYVDQGTPIINPINMVDGTLVTSDGPFLDAKDTARLSRYEMKTGDIVLGRKGDMGRAVYVAEQYDGYIVGSDCIRIRANTDALLSKYLYYFLISDLTKSWLSRFASGTTLPGVNEKTLSHLEIWMPSIVVQQEIVKKFEQLEDVATSINRKLEKNAVLARVLASRLLTTGIESLEPLPV